MVLELRTSSPMTIQPAVLIVLSDKEDMVVIGLRVSWSGRRWMSSRVSRWSIKLWGGPSFSGNRSKVDNQSRHDSPPLRYHPAIER